MESVKPDWSMLATAEHGSSELSNEYRTFQFKGPGWYYSRGGIDSVLITEDQDGFFWFHIYNGRDGRKLMDEVAKMPIHE